MPCRQVSTYNGTTGSGKTGGGGHATEADCLQACREGACCEGTTCTVKPQCQCQGTGKVFKGVGTTCEGNPCACYCDGGSPVPESIYAVLSGGTLWDQVVILNRLPGGASASWSSGMDAAGFNASFFSAIGTWWESKSFSNCRTFYAMLSGQATECPTASLSSRFTTSPVKDNSIGGYILLAIDNSGYGNCMTVLPTKVVTQNGNQCCWGLAGDSVSYGVTSFGVCSAGFSVSWSQGYGAIISGVGGFQPIGVCTQKPDGPSVRLHA